jgi:caffeyl-CoA reductase-Etf complex subunit CarC
MNFKPEHELVRKLARDFAEKELAPIVAEVDKTEQFPKEVLDKMAACGFFEMEAPKEFGGANADFLSYVIVVEEIARVSGIASMYISLPCTLAGMPLILEGTSEQKEKYLHPTVSGNKTICFALTEPGAGSNTRAMLTRAIKDGEYYVLNGRKCFITAAPIADYAIIFAKTKNTKDMDSMTCFVVDMKLPGISLGKNEEKMGMHGCPTSDIVLENVRVHESDIIGSEGDGFDISMKTLDFGRVGAAAQGIGIAQGALDEALKYADQRKQFNKKLSQMQGIAFMLADMQTMLAAAKLMVYEAAYLIDSGKDVTLQSSMAKYFATEVAIKIVDRALQIHGGYGYMKDYSIERMYRDVRVLSIYEGTSQIQQQVIAKKITG